MKAGRRNNLIGYGFILPWVIALIVFVSYPFFSALYFSFCDYPPLKGPMLIGTGNYVELAGDAGFLRSLSVTLIYASLAVPLGVLLAMSLAMLLNARVRGQSIYRVIFYLPHLVPTVVVALLWMWIYNPKVGLLNMVLSPVVSAIDGWAGLFFSLPSASAGGSFLHPMAMLLPATPLALLVLAIVLRRKAQPEGRPSSLRQAVLFLAVVAFLLAALAAGTALLHRLAPADMAKLHEPAWLSDGTPFPASVPFAPSWALWAMIIMSLWGVGQMAIIYLAKLQDVPMELYEAADMDGANWWHKVRHITVPMISPVILFNVVIAIIGTFQVFAEPYIMTRGGPEGKTQFLAMFIYEQAFQYQRLGYASAVAWAMFVIIVLLTVLAFGLSRKRVYYAGR